MSEQPKRKHRVIEWNPAAGQAAPPKSNRRNIKIMGALAALSLVVAAVAVTWAWRNMQPLTNPDGTPVAGVTVAAPEPEYVSRGRAELAYESARQNLEEVRRLPLGHQNLQQELILVEKAFLLAENQVKSGDYALAETSLANVNTLIDEFTETVTMQQDANKRYDDLFGRLRAIERAKSFDQESYDRAFTSTGEGRALLEQGSFRSAWDAFDNADNALKNFEENRENFIQNNLLAGQAALSRGDQAAADEAFRAALKYDHDNDAGIRGLQRAETIELVHALLEEAKSAEAAADFDLAIAAFEEAFELDSLSVVAQQGAARAKTKQKEARFDALVAAAEAAKDVTDWSTVIARYEEALEVYPDRSEISDAIDIAREEHHAQTVHNTLARAYDLERQHKWDDARDAYEELLELEPEHEDSIEGLIRVGRTVRALLQYEKHIDITQAHIDNADFQNAIRAYNKAMESKPDYLEISDSVERVRSLLDLNSRPIDVTFNSDGRTWVSISNYRLLGRIDTEVVALPPGDYEVIGRRKNYQDVMLLLRVRPNMSTRQVSVVCDVRGDT